MLRRLVIAACFIILIICAYTFLLGNKVFEGKFENEIIPWYFLAKGIFCSLALYLLLKIIEITTAKQEDKNG